jgi:hypothetical protein
MKHYIQVASTRSSALLQIIQIENEIKKIVKSKKYREIIRNLTILKNQAGHSIMELDDLDIRNRKINVRRNSITAKEYLTSYQSMLDAFETRITELGIKKSNLRKELFR